MIEHIIILFGLADGWSIPDDLASGSLEQLGHDRDQISINYPPDVDHDALVLSTTPNGSDLSIGASKERSSNPHWKLILLTIPLLALLGNLLILLSVAREKLLQTFTNYFICSLAVADIMVAVVVMPLALYVEIVSEWKLSKKMCDFYVACDVMACTASVFCLTAISVDRYIAVTQPFKYSKKKNSTRVYIMIALSWIVSAFVAMPIMLGMNVNTVPSPDVHSSNLTKPVLARSNSQSCGFYNADFLIFSPIISFYMPTVIMILLYWKIYTVLHQRAQAGGLKTGDALSSRGAAESGGGKGTVGWSAQEPVTGAGGGGDDPVQAGVAEETTNRGQRPSVSTAMLRLLNPAVRTGPGLTDDVRLKASVSRSSLSPCVVEDAAVAATSTLSVCDLPTDAGVGNDEDNVARDLPNDAVGDDKDNVARDFQPGSDQTTLRHQPPNPRQQLPLLRQARSDTTIGSEQITQSAKSQEGSRLPWGLVWSKSVGSQGGSVRTLGRQETLDNSDTSGTTGFRSNRLMSVKGWTRFNFHLLASRKRRQNTTWRETRATLMVATILGCFLVCWIPFYTMNFLLGLCKRHDLDSEVCSISPTTLEVFQWLGYTNSLLNPVVYTVFNAEFINAFKRIVVGPCMGSGRR